MGKFYLSYTYLKNVTAGAKLVDFIKTFKNFLYEMQSLIAYICVFFLEIMKDFSRYNAKTSKVSKAFNEIFTIIFTNENLIIIKTN